MSLPPLIDAARRDGVSRHIGDGSNRLSAVHVDDAARAYLAALDRLVDDTDLLGGVHNVAAEIVTAREIADAVARAAGVERVEGVTLEEAQATIHPFVALLLSMNFVLDASATRETLRWTPRGPGLLEDVATGSYARDR